MNAPSRPVLRWYGGKWDRTGRGTPASEHDIRYVHGDPAVRPNPVGSAGDIVVMDNLASHKVAGIKQAIESAGAELRYRMP